MTNRKYLFQCSNHELAYIFYNKIIPCVGRRYMETIGGISCWLEEEANELTWQKWKDEYKKIYPSAEVTL